MTIQTINPATEEVIAEYEEMSENEFNRIIDDTHDAFKKWRNVSFAKRAQPMLKLADLLKANSDEYAKLITSEMGKVNAAAQAEIEKCAWVCEHFANHAAKYLRSRSVKTEMTKSYVAYRPIGVIFAIMPWNFPFWQVFRFAAPALMAGNAALLKHAPISTGVGLKIESLFAEAGFPKNLFRTLILDNDGAAKVIANPKIAAVTLTGSERAGSAVGAAAARSLKKVVLELGGSDPYIILEDADLEAAAEAAVSSRMNNSGQVCIAAKRLIVVPAIKEKFEKLVMEKLNRYHMGDPMDDNYNFGPMSRHDLRDELHKQVQESVKKGAKLLKGGEIPVGKGYYYPPTVLTQVTKGMPAYDEELFGPVITFINAKNEKDAIAIANDNKYGLAAAVFTSNLKKGEKIAANKIEAGTCYVNEFVRSDPRLPFGGIRRSGYGRELSAEGIREFTNVKTVAVK